MPPGPAYNVLCAISAAANVLSHAAQYRVAQVAASRTVAAAASSSSSASLVVSDPRPVEKRSFSEEPRVVQTSTTTEPHESKEDLTLLQTIFVERGNQASSLRTVTQESPPVKNIGDTNPISSSKSDSAPAAEPVSIPVVDPGIELKASSPPQKVWVHRYPSRPLEFTDLKV